MYSTRRRDSLSEEGTQTIAMKLLQDLRKLPHFQTNILISGKEQTHLFTCQYHPGFRSLSSFLILLLRTLPGSDWTPVQVLIAEGTSTLICSGELCAVPKTRMSLDALAMSLVQTCRTEHPALPLPGTCSLAPA